MNIPKLPKASDLWDEKHPMTALTDEELEVPPGASGIWVTQQCVEDGFVTEERLRARGFTQASNGNWVKPAAGEGEK